MRRREETGDSWVGSHWQKKRRVEECEMFTIAGLHKEMRNGGGKLQSLGKVWLVLSKHAGLLQVYQNITPLPVR